MWQDKVVWNKNFKLSIHEFYCLHHNFKKITIYNFNLNLLVQTDAYSISINNLTRKNKSRASFEGPFNPIHCKMLENMSKWHSTCSALAIEPWHANSKTLLGSPNSGWDWSWSFNEFMSSQPVIKTKTAPGLSFLMMWQRTCSIRLNPIESGFQEAKESRVRGLYSLKSADSSISYLAKQRVSIVWYDSTSKGN